MKTAGKTAQFVGAGGRPLPNSIAEVGWVHLGGLDQWVMIRGEDIANPPLILLHGGPGMSETALFRRFNASLERSFTVVYWDQRGAGKSYSPDVPRSSMNLERFVRDLGELVDWVCARVGATRVALFGHSWGSAFGAHYAARHPERVAAYVGSGQGGDWALGESLSYAFAVREAERLGKHAILERLRAIGPPPHGPEQLWIERMCVSRLEGRMRPRELFPVVRALLAAPESSVRDLVPSLRGFRFSVDAMWSEVSRMNLLRDVPELKMPVFFFLGRKDHFVPPEASEAYFQVLRAPSKKLVWFEESKHEPFVDEADKFNAAMLELVRPILRIHPRPARAA